MENRHTETQHSTYNAHTYTHDTQDTRTPHLTPHQLIPFTTKAIDAFEPTKTTIDAHSDAVTAELHDAEDRAFVQQVLYGTYRYKKLLRVLVSALYAKHSGETQRSDRTLYIVVGYLATLRLSELTFADFRQLVLTQDSHAMAVLLKFLFDAETLQDWLRPEWLKHYDASFVDDQLIATLLGFRREAESLIKMLAGQLDAEEARKQAAADAARAAAEGRSGKGEVTEVVPFNLTQPRPRLVPVPDVQIQLGFKANPVPDSTYWDDSELADRIAIDRRRDQVRLETRKKYALARPPLLRTAGRPSTLAKLDKSHAEAEADYTFKPQPARPVPRFASSAPIRYNTSALLREDSTLRKRSEKEARAAADFEVALHDSSVYDAWRSRMRAEDEEARLRMVEQRRAEAYMADEEAKESRLRKLNEKKAIATSTKAEVSEQLGIRQRELESLRARHRGVVESVQSQRGAGAAAAQELVRANQQKARELREEMEVAEARLADERRAEAARRAELIASIRRLERNPPPKVGTAAVAAPSHGLLGEMSIEELRERLESIEGERREEEERKRKAILKSKAERELALRKVAERAGRSRDDAARAAARRKAATKVQAQLREAKRSEETANAQIGLQERIERKRAARQREEQRLADELQQIKQKNEFLGADKAALERRKWASLLSGSERQARARQSEVITGAESEGLTRQAELRQRRREVRRMREEKEAFLREYEATLDESRGAVASAAAEAESVRRVLRDKVGLTRTPSASGDSVGGLGASVGALAQTKQPAASARGTAETPAIERISNLLDSSVI